MNYELRIMNKSGGQAVITVVIITLLIGLVVAFGITSPAVSEAKISRELLGSKKVFAVLESGQEDVTYRIRFGLPHDATEVLTMGEVTATTITTGNVSEGTMDVGTIAKGNSFVRKKGMSMVKGDEVNFNYGIQSGNGGFVLQNSSSVYGNVYSNGKVTGAGNYIYGTVASASSGGLINGIHATGTARANTISASTVEGDAYYQTIQGSIVYGALHASSSDPIPQNMPISDDTLDEWEAVAQAGGVISSPCPYQISSTTSIGPIKINCNLTIKTHDTVTLTGTVWVVGDVSFETGPNIVVDPSFGARGVPIIADNPANRSTQSTISIKNTTSFAGSGTDGSLVMLLSRNTSAENGGTVSAIDLQQSASGDVMLYSNHGKVSIAQSSHLKEVTGWSIYLKNTAQVLYDSGLASSLFDTGPGGSWNISSWRETE